MRATTLLALAATLVAGLTPNAFADDALDHLDAAAACQRRGQTECTLERAERALAAMTDGADASIRREALTLKATALATLDRAEEAQRAFADLIAHDPAWRPFSDADARVIAAFQAAAPEPLVPSPETAPPDPLPVTTVEPLVYAPERITAIDLEAERSRDWRLGIGGGVALLMPDDQQRYLHGVAVAVDVSWQPGGLFGLWFQGSLSLHDFAEELSIEPGWGSGLTTASIVVGAVFTYPIIEDLDVFVCAGAGAGFHGVRSLGEAIGLAVDAGVGLRYAIDESLSVRIDVMPSLKVPIGADYGPAFHINAFLRGESRF